MTNECPKCQTNNPDTSSFCADCGTPLEADIIHTKTLETPIEELNTGSTFAGRYQIIEELGKGGMGRVFKVLDKETHEKIALKLIKPEIATDKKTIERFRNELTTARKIVQKNVCRMYDLNKETNRYFITMEYIEGQDLKGLIRQTGQLTVGKTISIAKQICDGLAEAHSLGVVHRDLKPNNIMIDRGGNAKIMDFGIARAVKGKSITGSGIMIGTPQYMSPEQVEGKDVDQRSDIYSLGIILYEMLTDRVPFEGDTPLAVGVKQKTETPKDPKDYNERIPGDLNLLILKCLEKDKENRYQSAVELKSDLDKLEQGLPTTDRVVPKKKTLTSKEITVHFSLKKVFIPILATIALAVIALMIWSPWAQKEPKFVSSDRPSLAVLYFRNGSGDQSLDYLKENLCDYLIYDLSQSKFIYVLDSSRIMSLLEKQDLLEANRYSADSLRSIAAAGGVTHVLTGSFSQPGEYFRIDYSLHDFRKGGEGSPDRIEGKEGEDITSLVDRMTHTIKAKLGLTQAEIDSDTDKEIGIILTADPEALQYYREGQKIFDKGQWRESILEFEKAVEIDPGFAMAYRILASAYSNLGNSAKASEYRQKALDNIGRMSYIEAKIIEGQYLVVEKDKNIEWFENLYEEYPENYFVNSSLGFQYSAIEDWDEVIDHIENIRKNGDEFVWDYIRLGEAYSAKKMYAKAREVYQDYIDNINNLADLHTYVYITYVIEGYYEQAQEAADKAIEQDPVAWKDSIKAMIPHLRGDFEAAEESYKSMLKEEDDNYQTWGRQWLEILYRTQGQFKKAAAEARAGLEYAEENSLNDLVRRFARILALHDLLAGDMDSALKKADILWESAADENLNQADILDIKIDALRRKTQAYLGRNDLEKAGATVEEMKQIVDDSPHPKDVRWYWLALGLLEIERKNYSQAADLFTRTYEMQSGQKDLDEPHAFILYYLALAYQLNGELELAKREYANIQTLTTGRIFWGDLYIKSYYQLGKIYEQEGSTEKAIEHYETFLDLWKDADPGLPEVEDAKERLAGLRGE
ncbi:protein kinase [Acidobacteriota bacterium]